MLCNTHNFVYQMAACALNMYVHYLLPCTLYVIMCFMNYLVCTPCIASYVYYTLSVTPYINIVAEVILSCVQLQSPATLTHMYVIGVVSLVLAYYITCVNLFYFEILCISPYMYLFIYLIFPLLLLHTNHSVKEMHYAYPSIGIYILPLICYFLLEFCTYLTE